MLRFGKISAVDASKAMYQVTFDEDQLVTDWIFANQKNTLFNKSESGYDLDEHVSCLMDENCENGVILGAIYDEENLPEVGNEDLTRIEYKDGSFIQFDRAAKKLTISCEGNIEIIKSTKTTIAVSDSIELNGSNKNGIMVAATAKTKYNNLENKVNALLSLLTAWVPVANDGGAALKTAYAALVTTTLAPLTVTTEIELRNDKVKHGS